MPVLRADELTVVVAALILPLPAQAQILTATAPTPPLSLSSDLQDDQQEMAGGLPGHLLDRQLPQLVIAHGQKVLGGQPI